MNNREIQFKKACEIAGLEVNGQNAHDPQILEPDKFYRAFAQNPYLAMGESFSAGHYTVDNLGDMITCFYQKEIRKELKNLLTFRQKISLTIYHGLRRLINPCNKRLFTRQYKRGQTEIAEDHYDLDNDLMVATLGLSMKYTSSYWYPEYGDFDLDTAQKLDLEIAGRRMGLKPGMKVLDIGFGFGTNTKYFVDRFGVHVTGITISSEQKKFAEVLCQNISDKTKFVLSDWRDVKPGELGYFDRVINFEMIESIGGPKNYPGFFQFMAESLNDDGAIFMQVINTNNISSETNPWIEKYIFPNGVLPTITSMESVAEKIGLHLRLVDNSLGWANEQTCKAWWNNFNQAWTELEKQIDTESGTTKGEKYMNHFAKKFPYEITPHVFQRIWKFYLIGCSAAHGVGYINDGHFIWEKNPKNASQADIKLPQTIQEVHQLLN